MPEIVTQVLADFGVNSPYEAQIIFFMIIAWAVYLVIQCILAANCQSQLALVRASVKKDIKDKADADKSKSAFFQRAAKDYAELGERGVARIDARELAVKSLARQKLLFFSYTSVESFLTHMEPAFLVAGILLTILAEAQLPFAVVTLILFVAGRILAAAFDYKAAKEALLAETAFLLDKEMGKLYATDIPASINNLRTELKNTITYQTKFLNEVINDLRDKLTAVSEKTLGDTAAAIKATLTSVSVSAETVRGPLNEWREVLLDSRKTHEELNMSVVRMSAASDGFRDNMETMSRVLDGYRDEFLKNNQNVERQLERLNTMTAAVSDACKNASSQVSAVEEAVAFVRRNQEMLQGSMNQYELALKDITASVGDGLGKIIDYHAQASVRAVSDGVAESIRQTSTANTDLMNKLQSLLDRILEQSRNETALIMNLKEQMELELNALRQAMSPS